MFVTCKIEKSISKVIDGKWETFAFNPETETEIPDDIGEALIKTYPHLYENVNPTLLPIPVESPNFSEEPAKEKPKKLGSKRKK